MSSCWCLPNECVWKSEVYLTGHLTAVYTYLSISISGWNRPRVIDRVPPLLPTTPVGAIGIPAEWLLLVTAVLSLAEASRICTFGTFLIPTYHEQPHWIITAAAVVVLATAVPVVRVAAHLPHLPPLPHQGRLRPTRLSGFPRLLRETELARLLVQPLWQCEGDRSGTMVIAAVEAVRVEVTRDLLPIRPGRRMRFVYLI